MLLRDFHHLDDTGVPRDRRAEQAADLSPQDALSAPANGRPFIRTLDFAFSLALEVLLWRGCQGS